MNDIIGSLKTSHVFPDWYEGLHKALFRSSEFFDDKDVLREEFINMLLTWEIEEEAAGKAYDFMTEKGKKKMNYELFSEFMKQFFTNQDPPGSPINMGL